MKVPRLNHPELYQGLYIFDFGDHVAVGYTAEEIEVLQSTEQYQHGRAYKIHSASPDGQLALRGVSQLDMSVREAMVFYREIAELARDDYEALKRTAHLKPPPTSLRLRLVHDPSQPLPYSTVLLYPAEYSDAISRWLQDLDYQGGEFAEANSSLADYFSQNEALSTDQEAIASNPRLRPRPPREILGTVKCNVQRDLTYP